MKVPKKRDFDSKHVDWNTHTPANSYSKYKYRKDKLGKFIPGT